MDADDIRSLTDKSGKIIWRVLDKFKSLICYPNKPKMYHTLGYNHI